MDLESCGIQLGKMAILVFLLGSILMGTITMIISKYIYNKYCRPTHDSCDYHNANYHAAAANRRAEEARAAAAATETEEPQLSSTQPSAPAAYLLGDVASCSYNSQDDVVRLPSYNEVIGGR